MPDADVLVVGAGLAGLVAARALTAADLTVALLEAGDGPGGRLATLRVGEAALDHGAQFFTVRTDTFADLVDGWRGAGVPVSQWSEGFAQATDIRDGPAGVHDTGGDGHPRYVVTGGMRTLAAVLAGDLDVRTGQRAQAVWRVGDGWRVAVATAGGATAAGDASHTLAARALLCTPPVPQSLALFDRGATGLPPQAVRALRAVDYDPCLALLATLDGDPDLPPPGGVQFAGGPVRWLADNARKGVSARAAVTVHAAGGWSGTWFDADVADVAGPLVAWLRPWLGAARVVATQVMRWRYAQPRSLVPSRTVCADVGGAPVAFAGDAFERARVEGAACSGLAAATALRAVLG